MRDRDFVRVTHGESGGPVSTRRWLTQAHARLKPMLPHRGRSRVLLTENLTDPNGRPIDVLGHFERNPDTLETVFSNFWGLMWSAQCSGRAFDRSDPTPPWPGFEDVRIPITPGFDTCGRLGLVKDGDVVREADCIVILAGIFGHNGTKRTEDLARAFLSSGFHVLAWENRGYGMTDVIHPDVYYTFGALGTRDLMIVADWLQDKPYVHQTGLIGFCWGANKALVAGWYENADVDRAGISDELAEHLPPLPRRRRFRAGVMAFSPTLDFTRVINKLDTPHKFVSAPVLATIGETVERRMREKNHPEVSGSLRRLIQFEYARSELNYPGAVRDGLRLLNLLPEPGESAENKLENARMPVLIVHGSNDPLAPANEIAEFMAEVENPNVAAIILYGGGHIGFASYARSYYFSLIMNFFDPVHGAAAMALPSVSVSRPPDSSADALASVNPSR